MDLLYPDRGWIAWLFDKLGTSPRGELTRWEQLADLDPGEVLYCAKCKNRITARGLQASIGGAHAHIFTNPAGIDFHIGCFSGAWGYTPVGAVTAEHSWFAGYSWRIINCSACTEHLGWRFTGNSDRFYGLILGKLVSGQDPRARF